VIDDCIRRIQAIKGLVADGTADSLHRAIEGLDLIHAMIVKDLSTISYEDSYSVDSEFDEQW